MPDGRDPARPSSIYPTSPRWKVWRRNGTPPGRSAVGMRFNRTRSARAGLFRWMRRRRLSGSLHVGPRFSPIPGTNVVASAHARPRSVLSDGLGRRRACQQSVGWRKLFGVRCEPLPLYNPGFKPQEAGKQAGAGLPVRTSSSCVTSSPSRTKGDSSICGATSACRWTGR